MAEDAKLWAQLGAVLSAQNPSANVPKLVSTPASYAHHPSTNGSLGVSTVSQQAQSATEQKCMENLANWLQNYQSSLTGLTNAVDLAQNYIPGIGDLLSSLIPGLTLPAPPPAPAAPPRQPTSRAPPPESSLASALIAQALQTAQSAEQQQQQRPREIPQFRSSGLSLPFPRSIAMSMPAPAQPLTTSAPVAGGRAPSSVNVPSSLESIARAQAWAWQQHTLENAAMEASRKRQRPNAPEELRTCCNCGVNSTPFWRKDRTSGLPLCNACGLYASKNDHPRPVKLWREDGQGESPGGGGSPGLGGNGSLQDNGSGALRINGGTAANGTANGTADGTADGTEKLSQQGSGSGEIVNHAPIPIISGMPVASQQQKQQQQQQQQITKTEDGVGADAQTAAVAMNGAAAAATGDRLLSEEQINTGAKANVLADGTREPHLVVLSSGSGALNSAAAAAATAHKGDQGPRERPSRLMSNGTAH